MKHVEIIRCQELSDLCSYVRGLVAAGNYEKCHELIYQAMADYPHAPQPHNLLGLVLEKTGNHVLAMKHFRAAWALDPTYSPASENLTNYGTFYSSGKDVYDECDSRKPKPTAHYEIQYDDQGIGRVVRRR